MRIDPGGDRFGEAGIRRALRTRLLWLLFLFCCGWQGTAASRATESDAAQRFLVLSYQVQGSLLLPTNAVTPLLSKHAGASVGIDDLANAAADLQSEYRKQGYPPVSVAIALHEITNGIVTLNVFHAAVPQIVLSGKRYTNFNNNAELAVAPTPALPAPAAPAVTNSPPEKIDAAEMARARLALVETMAELNSQAKDTRVHVISTNAGPRFEVEHYLVAGNSVLQPLTIDATLTNIDGAFGTNVSFDGIRTVVTELQGAYRSRGFVTVSVGLPQQRLTNATVKVQVNEGRLAAIHVEGNRYFSSNNVMRALPSLHTNEILNGRVFEAELGRANANQDRQIYPRIEPGPVEDTSLLRLTVKDRLPIHAKVELNNQSSPGTPDLRINTSAVDNNLWQHEHALGVQYSFSPERYKGGSQWADYDMPQVANYSAFYRMPLGNPESISDIIEASPDSFGYSEATRQFRLPPPSGQPELTVFGGRSTIDSGVTSLSSMVIKDIPGVLLIGENDVQQDLTINQNLGFRLSRPLAESGKLHATFSGGVDYKDYDITTYKTNNFPFTIITKDISGAPVPISFNVASAVPTTHRQLGYLPLVLRYDATWFDPGSTFNFGVGLSVNTWYSGSRAELQNITGSSKSSGHWAILSPSISKDFTIYPDWILTVRADGQWTTEPLISNEQFGAGGVNSVRGYREGEVFGDTGWHVTAEQQTPSHRVGMVWGKTPLVIRGSIHMDYAQSYLLDPQGRQDETPLWGAGFGGVLSIGSQWEARFLFSEPLSRTPATDPMVPFFNFALTGQF